MTVSIGALVVAAVLVNPMAALAESNYTEIVLQSLPSKSGKTLAERAPYSHARELVAKLAHDGIWEPITFLASLDDEPLLSSYVSNFVAALDAEQEHELAQLIGIGRDRDNCAGTALLALLVRDSRSRELFRAMRDAYVSFRAGRACSPSQSQLLLGAVLRQKVSGTDAEIVDLYMGEPARDARLAVALALKDSDFPAAHTVIVAALADATADRGGLVPLSNAVSAWRSGDGLNTILRKAHALATEDLRAVFPNPPRFVVSGGPARTLGNRMPPAGLPAPVYRDYDASELEKSRDQFVHGLLEIVVDGSPEVSIDNTLVDPAAWPARFALMVADASQRRLARQSVAQTITTENLCKVLYFHDLELVRLFIARGVDVNATCGDDPPLMRVLCNDDLMPLLLHAGANPNRKAARSQGKWALSIALDSRREDCARMLLAYGADPDAADGAGRTLLMGAVALEGVENVKFLIENRASINVETQEGVTALQIAQNRTGALYGVRRSPKMREIESYLVAHGARVNIAAVLREQAVITATKIFGPFIVGD